MRKFWFILFETVHFGLHEFVERRELLATSTAGRSGLFRRLFRRGLGGGHINAVDNRSLRGLAAVRAGNGLINEAEDAFVA